VRYGGVVLDGNGGMVMLEVLVVVLRAVVYCFATALISAGVDVVEELVDVAVVAAASPSSALNWCVPYAAPCALHYQ
jgi:hypothetical protein